MKRRMTSCGPFDVLGLHLLHITSCLVLNNLSIASLVSNSKCNSPTLFSTINSQFTPNMALDVVDFCVLWL